MQNITIIGNLTKDAELKTSNRQGVRSEFMSFTVACNEDRGEERTSTFYDVTAPKSGALEYLKKGSKVAVTGRFRFVMSKDQTGREYPHLNVWAQNLELAGARPEQRAQQPQQPAPEGATPGPQD